MAGINRREALAGLLSLPLLLLPGKSSNGSSTSSSTSSSSGPSVSSESRPLFNTAQFIVDFDRQIMLQQAGDFSRGFTPNCRCVWLAKN